MDESDHLILSESGVLEAKEANRGEDLTPTESKYTGSYYSVWVVFISERWRRLLDHAMLHSQEVRFRGETWLVKRVYRRTALIGRIEPYTEPTA